MWIELEQRILKLNTRKNVTHFNMCWGCGEFWFALFYFKFSFYLLRVV